MKSVKLISNFQYIKYLQFFKRFQVKDILVSKIVVSVTIKVSTKKKIKNK